jgi:hypothetical protein
MWRSIEFARDAIEPRFRTPMRVRPGCSTGAIVVQHQRRCLPPMRFTDPNADAIYVIERNRAQLRLCSSATRRENDSCRLSRRGGRDGASARLPDGAAVRLMMCRGRGGVAAGGRDREHANSLNSASGPGLRRSWSSLTWSACCLLRAERGLAARYRHPDGDGLVVERVVSGRSRRKSRKSSRALNTIAASTSCARLGRGARGDDHVLLEKDDVAADGATGQLVIPTLPKRPLAPVIQKFDPTPRAGLAAGRLSPRAPGSSAAGDN